MFQTGTEDLLGRKGNSGNGAALGLLDEFPLDSAWLYGDKVWFSSLLKTISG